MGINTPSADLSDGDKPKAKPQYVIELEELEKNGGLNKVKELFKTQADVWIKRSNGRWQICKVNTMDHGGLSVVVEWFDNQAGKKVNKYVETKDFLRWQDEPHT